MKTQIIQLSLNEDSISVREKISWSQARRILLVWPPSGRLLANKLDLNLVARHSASLGSRLALVTHDPQVRDNAHQLGISVFDHPRDALEADWLPGNKTVSPREQTKDTELVKIVQALRPGNTQRIMHPALRIACLCLSLLALFVLLIFILPGAKIFITPQVQIQTILFNLSADPSSQVLSYTTGNLPTYTAQVIVEGRSTTAATGSVTIPDKPATGFVSFTNVSDKVIKIPVGTIVSTGGSQPIQFITTSPSDVSVLPDDTTVQPVRAMRPGLSGNLPAFHLSEVEGTFSPQLLVTNLEAMSGGSEAAVPAPRTEDLASLRQRLLDQLQQDAQQKLLATLPNYETLITPTITVAETINETSFPAIGDPGNQLELSLALKVEAHVISGEMVRAFVSPLMDTQTPQGYAPVEANLAITNLSTPTIGTDGKAHWTIQATRDVRAAIPPETAAAMAAGKTMKQATDLLSAYLPVSRPASIMLSPSWWPRLPLLAMRIQVLQQDGQ